MQKFISFPCVICQDFLCTFIPLCYGFVNISDGMVSKIGAIFTATGRETKLVEIIKKIINEDKEASGAR